MEELLLYVKACNEADSVAYERKLYLTIVGAYYSGYYSVPSKHRKKSPDAVYRSLIKKDKDTSNDINPEEEFKKREEIFKNGGTK